MAGKGSKPRPLVVPKEDFDKKFETIFGKKEPRNPWIYIPPETQPDTKTDNK
jgi:hypothetical protein